MESSGDRTKISDAICRLHIHAGLRRDDLWTALGQGVRTAWHIGEDDNPEVVSAKAIGQVRKVLEPLRSDRRRRIAEVLLNMCYESALCAEFYEERKVALAKCGRGYSAATTYRTLSKEIYPMVERAVHARPAALSTHEIDEIVNAEREHRARVDGGPGEAELERFLSNDIYLSRSPQPGHYFVVDVPGHGMWIKVFTSVNKLAEDAGADTGKWLSMAPADLVQDVCKVDASLGILVDPNVGSTLLLTPDIVRRLAERLR
jgi:hypothetical protein